MAFAFISKAEIERKRKYTLIQKLKNFYKKNPHLFKDKPWRKDARLSPFKFRSPESAIERYPTSITEKKLIIPIRNLARILENEGYTKEEILYYLHLYFHPILLKKALEKYTVRRDSPM
jgi:hypothetical protein